MAEVINLATFQLDTQKLQTNLNELQDTYFDLRKEQKAYSDQSKETAKQLDLLAKTQKTLTTAAGDNTEAIEKNEKEMQDLLKTQKELYKSEQNLGIQMGTVRKEINQTTTQLRAYQDAEGKTASLIDLGNQALTRQIKNKNDARAANIALNNVANQLNPNIEEEAKLLVQLNSQMDKNTKFIKDNSSETAKQKMNIGNYTQSLKEAIEQSGLMSSTLQSLGPAGKVAEIGFKQIGTAVSDVKDAFTNYKVAQQEIKVAQESYIALTAIATEATEASAIAEAVATQIGFRYAQGTATQAEAEAAATTATIAHTTAVEAQATAQTAATAVTNASSASLKLFKIALISTGIGAIVVLLGSFVAFLASTQEGIDKVTSVTRPLVAIFQSLLGAAQNLGKSMFDAFSNPKKLLTDLVDFVKNNVMNRFKALGVVLDGIVNLDFGKIKDGILQGATGVENLTGKIANAGKATGKFFADAATKGAEIDRITKDIEKSQLIFNKNTIAVNDALDKQLLISKDTSKSFKEREAAAREIIRITKAQGEEEAKIIEKKIKLLDIEQSLNDTNRKGNQEAIDLQIQLDAAKDRGVEAEKEQLRVIGGARKEQQALAKKASEENLKRIQEEQDATIKAMQTELDIYLADAGERKKSMKEQNEIDQEVMRQSLAINAKEFDAKKKTRREFELENIRISNEFLAKQVELTTANAETELDIQMEKNQRILENDKYLSEEQLKIKQEALTAELEAQKEYELIRFTNGVTSLEEYNRAINEINRSNDEKNAQLLQQKKAAEQEKQLLDLENEKALSEENFIAQSEIETQQNEIKRQQEVSNAEKTGADVSVINAKYAQLQDDIESRKQENKVQLASDAFGSLASIFGEESKAGKAAAIAQTTIDTYQSAISAFKSLAGIPYVGPVLGGIASAAAITAGFKAVKQITATKTPTFKQPSYASGVIGLRGSGSGTSDDITANLSAGESVINARSTSMFANELSAINQAGGGVGLNGASNILNQNQLNNNANNSQMAKMISEAVAIGAEAGTAKGANSGIKELSNDRKVMADAKF